MDSGLVAGVISLGILHGVLPDHGWPIAATYALERSRQYLHGTIAALVLGTGHLVSSVVLVLAYFWFSTFAAFAEGPWMKPLAGVLLVLLGIHEYVNSHHHGADDGATEAADHDHHDAGHDRHDEGHTHSHSHAEDHGSESGSDSKIGAALGKLRNALPGGGHGHFEERHAKEGLRTLGVTALLLGFAHEEPVQILAICAGTEFCLELMLVYSLAVILAILAPTLLLITGYQSHQERIERYTPYLPAITAAVLIGVGLGFIFGVF